MKPSTSTPNLVRIARDPKLYDEAVSRIEERLETTGYGKRALTADTPGYGMKA